MFTAVTIAAPETIGSCVADLARRTPDRCAIVFADDQLTWAEVYERAVARGRGLIELGIVPGDGVAVLLPNGLDWFVTNIAVALSGGVFLGLNTWYQLDDLLYVLVHSGAKVLVASDEAGGVPLADLARGLTAGTHQLERVVSVDGAPTARANAGDIVSMVDVDLAGGASSAALPVRAAHDLAAILYTSGTTSAPKGVCLHHGSLLANGYSIGERQHLVSGDVLWVGIPMFFSFFSANALMAGLTHGVTFIVQKRFDPREALDLMERHRCTVYYGMPNMTAQILAASRHQPRAVDSLRTGLTIGPPEVLRETARLVPGICNVYGLTETYGNCAVTDAEDDLETRATTQGRPLPGMEIRVVDESGSDEPTGRDGRILVRGHVTSGYFREPELTAEAFRFDGWFDTGDLGAIDDEGRVRYKGRLKELIKTGGINVSPVQVEAVLATCPGVIQAHVVGIPHAVDGEIVVAAIEWEGTAEVETARSVCLERLPRYAVPVRYVSIKESDLPRTASGKVRRSELAARLVADDDAATRRVSGADTLR
jgi:fatty-acyl-CoA synthase